MKKRPCLGKELHRLDVSIGRSLYQGLIASGLEELSGTNGRIIRFLSEHETTDVYQRDLEKEFGITRSTASRVITLMEEKGLVTRNGVSHDARLKKLALTDKARSFSDLMRSHGEQMDQTLLAGFSEEETRLLFSMIERMQHNLAAKA